MAHNLSKSLSRVEAGLRSASRVMAIIAACFLAVMMLLTAADVCGRYFFNRPIPGTWELVALLLIPAATWGLAYCQIQRRHIRIMIFVERFPPRFQAILNSFAYLIGIGGFSLICWQMGVMGKKYIFLPTGGLSEDLGAPYFPFMFALAIGAGMLAVILLADLVHSLAEVVRK